MRTLLRQPDGFSFIEILLVMGVVGIALGSLVTYGRISESYNFRAKNIEAIYKVRSTIIGKLRGSDSLAKIGEQNAIDCLKTRTACASASTDWTPISISEETGQIITSANDAGAGFTVDALPCGTFPSLSCPFSYRTQWRALCTDAVNCSSPQNKISGKLLIMDNYKTSLNADNFSFEISSGQVIGSYEQSCTSLGGSYIPGEPPKCALMSDQGCGVDAYGNKQIMVGYDRASKTILCRPFTFINGSCPAGLVMIGVKLDGSPVCKGMIAPSGCSSLTDPTCNPFPCQVDSTLAGCSIMAPLPGDGGGFGDGGGGGGCGGDSSGGGGGCGAM